MLSRKIRKSLLSLARNSIQARLQRKSLPSYKSADAETNELRGAFVTLHKMSSLRGCIGYVEAIKPLYQSVQDMAVAAAFQDPRFPSLGPEEFPDIEIEISVMSPLKRIKSIDEIEVGIHGIIIKRGFHQGLLLPQVATEHGWDRETFLQHTCLKAGLNGDEWKLPDTEIYIFSAEVFSEQEY